MRNPICRAGLSTVRQSTRRVLLAPRRPPFSISCLATIVE
ncbi:hypothetical protein E2C01_102672 [Portunus trituberculatus]|uniref:Uncharacterized protein n=1 Tax=Portunus trituberculatus TaxID=210409 RepID=A0A5B7KHW9_PORTR|nr:hypothetical protein [Portunus trituberculatus]